MTYSETQNTKTILRASCGLAWHSLVNHNECSRSKQAWGKNGRESGQIVGMFKKCISDPYHESRSPYQCFSSPDCLLQERVDCKSSWKAFIMKRFLSPTFSSLILILSCKCSTLCWLGSGLQCAWKRMSQEETNKRSCSGEFWQSIKKPTIIHSWTSFFQYPLNRFGNKTFSW